nr:hypothetical protein [Methanothermus fervidus]
MKSKAVLTLSTLLVLLAISQAYGAKEVYPEYGSLKDVIENSNHGETIFLHKGTYHASGIVIDKNLTIVGEYKDGVVIDALWARPYIHNFQRCKCKVDKFNIDQWKWSRRWCNKE